MADTSTENTSTQGPPDWFVRACKWLWKKRGFFWGTISLGIALNVIASLAYQSNENEKVASDVIRALLTPPQNANQEQKKHDLLLAADCLIEARPLAIESELEKQVADQLLQTYEEAQQCQQFDVCERIEAVIRHWLVSLPREAYRLPLLTALRQSISDTSRLARQRATLTLLTMIAQQLDAYPSSVFEMLIPPLLALAG